MHTFPQNYADLPKSAKDALAQKPGGKAAFKKWLGSVETGLVVRFARQCPGYVPAMHWPELTTLIADFYAGQVKAEVARQKEVAKALAKQAKEADRQQARALKQEKADRKKAKSKAPLPPKETPVVAAAPQDTDVQAALAQELPRVKAKDILSKATYGQLRTAVSLLAKDLQDAQSLSQDEAKFLVGNYYRLQESRLRGERQLGHLQERGYPSSALAFLTAQSQLMEDIVLKALDTYSLSHPVGAWARSILGIGPVLASGCLAYVRLTLPPKEEGWPVRTIETAGHVWSYAGLLPQSKRVKGVKANFNPAFKQIAYHIGNSFVYLCNNPKSFYGQLFKDKKDYYARKNESGGFADRAAETLAKHTYTKGTAAYAALASGRLPKAALVAMARRYVAQIFLAHFFEKLYEYEHGRPAPAPYPIAALGHVHVIKPPSGEKDPHALVDESAFLFDSEADGAIDLDGVSAD